MVVFEQLHDVAVFGLMVDAMRGKARRWSESVISRELKCGNGELKLFNAIPAMARKGEDAVDAAHMSRTGDNEVGLSTAQVSSIFRNPTQMPCNRQTTSAPFYYSVHLHGLIVARNKGKRAIDKRGQPL